MSDQNTSETGVKIRLADIRGPEFRQVFDAFLGFDLRLLVTVRDLILHPVRVAREALSGRQDTYLGQVRLFIFIFGLTTLFLSMAKMYDAITVQSLFNNNQDLLTGYSAILAENGITLDQVNAAMKGWTNLLISPTNLIFTLVIAVFFKIIAPKITFLGHVLLFIITNNASSILGMPLTIIAVKVGMPTTIAALLPMVIQFFYLSIIVWVFMRKTVADGILKLFLMALAFFVAMIVIGLFMQVMLHIMAHNEFGTSPAEYMIRTTVQAARAAQNAP